MNLVPESSGDRELSDAIKELSRLKYGRDKSIVEGEIMARTQMGQKSKAAPPPPVPLN